VEGYEHRALLARACECADRTDEALDLVERALERADKIGEMVRGEGCAECKASGLSPIAKKKDNKPRLAPVYG
jgi:hypothetical protein